MQERWKRSGYSKSKVHLSLYNIFLNPQLLWVRFLRLFSDSWSRYFFIFYLTITLARFIVDSSRLTLLEEDFAALKAEQRDFEQKITLMISKLSKLEKSVSEEDIEFNS